jgi:hypothetical protein
MSLARIAIVFVLACCPALHATAQDNFYASSPASAGATPASTSAVVAAAPSPGIGLVGAVLVALAGGIGGALVTGLLGRGKARAEADKSRAETEKINLEIKQLSATVRDLSATTEHALIDATAGIDGFVVRGKPGKIWQGSGAAAVAVGPEGAGELVFEPGGVLSVKRTNTGGRFELSFRQYSYEGSTHALIKKNDAIAGKRRIRVACEAKTIGAEHTLRFVLRNPDSGQRFAEESKVVRGNEWVAIEVFLLADPTQDAELRIDDEQVSATPSSVQIRKIFVAERVA